MLLPAWMFSLAIRTRKFRGIKPAFKHIVQVIRRYFKEIGLLQQAKKSYHLFLPQHFLYFFPLPQGQGAFLPIFSELISVFIYFVEFNF